MKAPRIFALAPDCHVEGWRYGPVWRTHFYEGLQGSGAEVFLPTGVSFDWARPPQEHVREEHTDERVAQSRALLRQIRDAASRGLDAVVSYCFSHDLELEIVDQVRAMGVPWINFFCDSLYAFHTVEALARRATLNWFVESMAEPFYRELGVPYLWAPYALNPDGIPDAACRRPERRLAFIGTANGNRATIAAQLRLVGVDLHVAGWGWRERLEGPGVDGRGSVLRMTQRSIARKLLAGRIDGHVGGDAFVEYLRGTQVVLGLNEGKLPGRIATRYLKLRDVEFPGMGCAYLAQHHEDLELVFDVGREVRTFRTILEAREIARELARDLEGCRRMGEMARERVLAEHTWATRLPALLDALP